MNGVRVKICGLSTEDTLDAALEAGADLVGFVHFRESPRHVAPERAAALAARARGRAERVLLLVDPDDALLDALVEAADPDLIQLHGRETPERVAAVRARSRRPVMKALGIAVRDDLAGLAAYEGVADRILLDAKAPPDAALPGGNGRAFDWALLAGTRLPEGWMLSGGLDPASVGAALARTGARAVDVSSGVESGPGVKDPERIAAFVKAVRGR
ncbi:MULTISPECIES: phosphoribosylanthranilate isomerase [Methylobacterium]|uniref:N-(5'-phosphoribosyl)anthranilate isomerase n=1 Tax=Methylobacterium jeotgali TaxID=381630 RepID=A0ABQ4SZ69_9HYPH|nr:MULTISPECIES: phosphoribosylanthranilate isomerase [Methylobacterium]PIU04431.1 MAG: phosphoribosylanthranilate isomerase [Methylobacterium sp. CG09_land_8_20_14_0_10_71_15]PIU11030.1 MAG: phosphoribosylanthranilate isomerase [Methylobacterium sp. CG08_land_8_20_14_0_20_71_15]GBU20042.1 N-(5'-phosphoribosyl)anthranilate isomerase [Methylobacterium sp.]GJE08167.1 N-(5'-phosphoribosyl)anthranilate isomerase [Methylobacterium jeotgali]